MTTALDTSVIVAALVRAHPHHERALPCDLVCDLESSAERTGPGRREVPQQMQRVEERPPALPWALDGRLGAERDRAETVSATRCRIADRNRDPFCNVSLSALRGAKGHRRRRIEHEPRDEHTFREFDANMRVAGSRRDVPLDPTHVVARFVRPHLPELGADTRERGLVVAGEQPVDAAADGQFERTQRR